MASPSSPTETELQCERSLTTLVPIYLVSITYSLALGIIPAGTSNGLAESLGWSDPYKAVKGLIENDVKFLDAFEITTLEGAGDSHSKTRWDLHSVNWGMFQGLSS